MNIDYYEKYLKYKQKYINLKYYGGVKCKLGKVDNTICDKDFPCFQRNIRIPKEDCYSVDGKKSLLDKINKYLDPDEKYNSVITGKFKYDYSNLFIQTINAGVPGKTDKDINYLVSTLFKKNLHEIPFIYLIQEIQNSDSSVLKNKYYTIEKNYQYVKYRGNFNKQEDSMNIIIYNNLFFNKIDYINFDNKNNMKLKKNINITNNEIDALVTRSSGLLVLKDRVGNTYLVISVHAKEIRRKCEDIKNDPYSLNNVLNQLLGMKDFYNCIIKLIKYANNKNYKVIFGGDWNSNLQDIQSIIDYCNRIIDNPEYLRLKNTLINFQNLITTQKIKIFSAGKLDHIIVNFEINKFKKSYVGKIDNVKRYDHNSLKIES